MSSVYDRRRFHAAGAVDPCDLGLIGAVIVLIGVAAVASIMPAMRASSVDVSQALRSE